MSMKRVSGVKIWMQKHARQRDYATCMHATSAYTKLPYVRCNNCSTKSTFAVVFRCLHAFATSSKHNASGLSQSAYSAFAII